MKAVSSHRRCSWASLASFSGAVLIAWSVTPTPAIEPLRETVVRDAPVAWRRYREHASRYFQGRCVWRLSVDGKEVTRVSHRFKQRPDARLWVQDRQNDVAGKPTPSVESVLGVNDAYSFRLRRSSDRDHWYVSGVWPHVDGNAPLENPRSEVARAVQDLGQFTCALLRLSRGHSLQDLFEQPSFKILEMVEEVGGEPGAEPAVRLVFDNRHPRDEAPFFAIQGGSLLLDPSQSWCLRSAELACEYSTGSSKSKLGTDYIVAATGFPIPRRWTEQADEIDDEEGGKHRSATSECAFEVDDSVGLPDVGDFRLSAFGIPEPTTSSRPIKRFVILAVVGALLVLSGAALRRRLGAGRRHA